MKQKEHGDAQRMLFEAINRRDFEQLERALERGANVNALNTERNHLPLTPLWHALTNNHEGMARALIKEGADISLSISTGLFATSMVEDARVYPPRALKSRYGDTMLPWQAAEVLGMKSLSMELRDRGSDFSPDLSRA